MSKEILYCYALIKPLLGTVDMVLFDRGFYSKELMHALTAAQVPYLIFVPKNPQVSKELDLMTVGEKKIQLYNFTYAKNRTAHHANTFQVFLKGVYSKRLDKELDWAFATNIAEISLDCIIKTYMQRWKIETDFRLQDEATIKCKSTDIMVRYFLFVYEQLLQIIWGAFYQKEVSFKGFQIGRASCRERE